MPKGNFGGNKSGFVKMPRNLTSKPKVVKTKTLSFGNATGGRVSGNQRVGLGRFPK